MKKIKITPEMARDLLHNLDPKNPEHMEIYETTLYHYMVGREGFEHDAYDDARPTGRNKVSCLTNILGNVTVGIGFNMDADGGRDAWNSFFKGGVDFDEVYKGKARLNTIQIDDFFAYNLKLRRAEIYKNYKNIYEKLRLNERLVLEDLYYNGPSLVYKESAFYKYINTYYNTGDIKYLEKAVYEVRYRSNKTKNKGIQVRRNMQATILDSTKANIFSGPFDPRLPQAKIKAKLGETIIPRGTEDWAKPTHSDYYIWRTQCDKKVRESHLLLEGKIFSKDFKPVLGNPSEDYNCRCIKEILPRNIEVIKDEKEPISKKYFDINMDLFSIELHNLSQEVNEFLNNKITTNLITSQKEVINTIPTHSTHHLT